MHSCFLLFHAVNGQLPPRFRPWDTVYKGILTLPYVKCIRFLEVVILTERGRHQIFGLGMPIRCLSERSMQAAVMRKHMQKHRGGCSCAVFSSSGNYAATGGHDGIVRIWNASDGSLLSELTPPTAHTAASINCVQFSEDKGVVMAASNDKSIAVWDFHTGRQRFTMTGQPQLTPNT